MSDLGKFLYFIGGCTIPTGLLLGALNNVHALSFVNWWCIISVAVGLAFLIGTASKDIDWFN